MKQPSAPRPSTASAGASASARIFLAALLVSAAAGGATTSEDLARHSMSIEQLNSILSTEVPSDFGEPLTADEANELWTENAAWMYDHDGDDSVALLDRYRTYLYCYNETGLSGNERNEIVKGLVQDARGDGGGGKVYRGDTVYNSDDRSCYLASMLPSTVESVLVSDQPPEKAAHIEINPQVASIKAPTGLYKAIAQRIAGSSSIDKPCDIAESPCDGQVMTLEVKDDEVLAVDIVMCPAVQEAITSGEETFKEAVKTVNAFMRDSAAVKGVDFFSNVASQTGRKVSNYMTDWHGYVDNVSPYCLDDMIKNQIRVDQYGDDVAAVSFPLVDVQAQVVEECLWYVVRSLSLHHYVCHMDLRPVPVVAGARTVNLGGDNDVGKKSAATNKTVLGATGIALSLGLALAAMM